MSSLDDPEEDDAFIVGPPYIVTQCASALNSDGGRKKSIRFDPAAWVFVSHSITVLERCIFDGDSIREVCRYLFTDSDQSKWIEIVMQYHHEAFFASDPEYRILDHDSLVEWFNSNHSPPRITLENRFYDTLTPNSLNSLMEDLVPRWDADEGKLYLDNKEIAIFAARAKNCRPILERISKPS